MRAYYDTHPRKWHQNVDWQLIMCILAIGVGISIIIFSAICSYYNVRKLYDEWHIRLEESEIENERMKFIYENQTEGLANLKREIISQQQMAERKKVYDIDEITRIKADNTKYETELATQLLPVGTYIYHKELKMALRVKGYEGLQGFTYEDVRFMVTDDYKLLSYYEYAKYKGKR